MWRDRPDRSEPPEAGAERDAELRARRFDDPARGVVWEPSGPGVVARIEHWMASTPDAPAILWDGPTVSYRELDAASARLAAWLRQLGAGPERSVAVVAERGPGQIIGVLAALRAGGAYVPIKPDLPGKRIAQMIEETAPVAILCDGPPPPAMAHAGIVRLDAPDAWPALATAATLEVPHDALAYIIYTSGSTGRPKGVMIARRAFDAQMRWIQDAFPRAATDRWLQLHSFTFDASISEMFWPLIAGGAMVLPRPGDELDPRYLGALIARTEVTVVHFVPSMMWALLESLDASQWATVELLVTGGEALSAKLARRCAQAFPRAALINTYGPTETTVNATWCRYHDDGTPVSIGVPVANTTGYVLDADLAPVPPGATGELCIGGIQVARGYLERPGLTAERFLPDPFAARPGERIYRTGDLVRQRADGMLEYVGRGDFQVKVRGFRIELGEIEAVLQEHPSVHTAVVVAREAPAGGKLLVGYLRLITPSSPSTPVSQASTAALRAFLAERLPAHMVPSAFVALEELPLTVAGKIDRDRLPAPAEDAFERAAHVAPRTELEAALAGIWREVLGVQHIGVDDDFFALGGHSLVATQVISRVRAQLAIELPIRAVFEAPTIAGLAARLEAIGRGTPRRVDPVRPVGPVGRDGELAVSLMEQRLWLLDRLEPSSARYNIADAVSLRGALDVAALERALDAVVRRHEALRTTFVTRDNRAARVIAPSLALALPVIDLDGAARDAELRRLTAELASEPFDLARGPLIRVRLLRLGPGDHVLLLIVHHIVFDGWSGGVFWRDLAAFYQAFATGREPALPALAIQYADFAAWQRTALSAAAIADQVAYWKRWLAGSPTLLELPTDRPRPPVMSYRGALRAFQIAPALTAALHAVSRAESVTLFMTLIAAFQTLLHRYSRQDDILVGTPVANRNRAEIEELIGFFVNTVVVRGDLSGNPSFRALLGRVREVALGAYAHQDLPFEKLVEELQPERSRSHSPVFQVAFALQNAPEGLAMAGIEQRAIQLDTGTSKFDLTLYMEERPEGLLGWVEYATDLFDEATIARMIGHFERLLAAIAADPGRRLSALPLLGDDERRELARWNATARDLGGELIHAAFARQAAATPSRTALVFEGQALSYAELDARANQLAHRLQELGVGPEALVGVAMERSLELVISLYAILKAGGAYVPFDPGYPAERLAYMIGDARPRLLLIQDRLRGSLPAAGTEILAVDTAWPEIARRPAGAPRALVRPASLAYVIYTSGSTGRPKGAMNSHEAIANRLHWMQDRYRLGPDDRVLQKTPLSFDVSVWELFWPLMVGARLVVARPGGHQDPGYLVDTIVREAITTLHFVPPMLAAFLEAGGVQRCTSLRRVMSSGEALPYELAVRFRDRLGAALHNLYGPTEAAVDVSHWTCEPGGPPVVPIGHPIANLRLHVLDAELEPVPLGAAGELYLAGLGLGRGYLGRPALTAERFVPDPRSPAPGGRLYRTGDLGRHRSDGAIEYLGRVDHQVKLRGFRIELGEIEAVLAQVEGVREAVVVLRVDGAGDSQLVAYVAGGAAVPGASALRAHLEAKLPAYMVPPVFVVLGALPLSPSGKIDRAALPPPDGARARARYVAPRTPTEQVLTALWGEVLGVERIGIHDNFFSLGGHSLLVVRLVARISKELALELPPTAVFEHPTIAGLAARIDARSPGDAAHEDAAAERALVELVAALPEAEVTAQLAEWSAVMLEAVPSGAASELSAARRELVERLLAQHRIDARPSQPLARRASRTAPATFAQQLQWDYHQRGNFPTLGIHTAAFAVRGPLDTPAMAEAIAAVVDHQAALRTSFGVAGDHLIQTVHDRGPELDVVDLSSRPSDERAARVRELFEAMSRPHDLGREVFRARLVRLDPGHHVLILAPHHIVVDGFSWDVLEADLAALYRAAARGDAPVLAPLAVQYRDFCFWQRSLERRPVGRDQLAFWARAIAGYDSVVVPGDGPAVSRGAVGMATDTYPDGAVPFVLDGAAWQAVERLCGRLGCTPYAVIATSFFLLVSRWSRRGDVCVLSGNYHRNRPGSEAVLGNFVTPYPLRMAIDERATLDATVQRCQAQVLVHREHGHVAPTSALSAWPEWSRYNLNYLLDPADDAAADFGPVTVQRLGWSALPSRTPHDLALFVRQRAGGVRGSLVYNAERFSRELAGRTAALLGQLIETICATPSARVGTLPRAP